MAKLNFQQPLHDPSENILICWFGAQETFIINIKNGCAALYS